VKFSLLRDAQNRAPMSPVTLDVTKEPRSEYSHPCSCVEVYRVADIQPLVEQRLVLATQSGPVFVCACLGAIVEVPPSLAPESFPDLLRRFKSAWRPSEYAMYGDGFTPSDESFERDLNALLAAYLDHATEPEPALHMPTLTRSLMAWDTETTGVDPVLDRLVSIGVCVLNPDGTRRRWETLLNPEMPIPPEVTEIHGITNEMVASAPKFCEIARKFMSGLAGKDMLLYNGRRLDLPILDESLRRCGMKLDLTGVRVIDAAGLFFKENPRDLSAFVERYTRRRHEGAHSSAADAEGTLNGYLGMLAEHEDLRGMTLDEQAVHSMYGDDPDRLPCDLAGKLYLKGGEVYFGFGKAKDKRVSEDAGYAYWILKCSDPPFPGSTRDCLRVELDRLGL
jgi:DNA polymerase-3 subunit epsilon